VWMYLIDSTITATASKGGWGIFGQVWRQIVPFYKIQNLHGIKYGNLCAV